MAPNWTGQNVYKDQLTFLLVRRVYTVCIYFNVNMYVPQNIRD